MRDTTHRLLFTYVGYILRRQAFFILRVLKLELMSNVFLLYNKYLAF